MTVSDYYNDNDPGATAWLEALASESEIPAGTVDSRPATAATRYSPTKPMKPTPGCGGSNT